LTEGVFVKIILVVDDELAIVDLVTILLEEGGYKVAAAHNGREALATLEHLQPDLVLCDWMMPILDGAGVCRAMQANSRYRAIPLVLMSARGTPPSPAQCVPAAFLAKPFEPQTLLELLARLLSREKTI